MKDNESNRIEGELTDEDLKQVAGGTSCVPTNVTTPVPVPVGGGHGGHSSQNQNSQGQDGNSQH
jgi:hypothetical protein